MKFLGIFWSLFLGIHCVQAQKVIPMHYDEISGEWLSDDKDYFITKDLNARYFSVSRNGLFGLADSNGQLIVPVKYDQIHMGLYDVLLNAYPVSKDGRSGLVNEKGEELNGLIYSGFDKYLTSGLFVFEGRELTKKGLINSKGEVLLLFEYDNISSNEHFILPSKGSYYSSVGTVYSKKLVPILDFKVSGLNEFKNGYSIVKKGNKSGFLDTAGRLVVPCIYDKIKLFSEGFAAVQRKGMWTFVNESGEELLPPQFNDVDDFLLGFAEVNRGAKPGPDPRYENLGGEFETMEVDIEMDFGADSEEETHGGKWGLIDTNGHFHLECQYDDIWYWKDRELMVMKKDDKAALFDFNGNALTDFKYDWINVNAEGISYTLLDEKEGGVLNEKGEEVREKNYEFVSDFHHGLAKAIFNDKTGVVNNQGKEVIATKYDGVKILTDELISVNIGGYYSDYRFTGGKWGVVNAKGEILMPIEFESVAYPNDRNYSVVKKNGKLGLVHLTNGQEIIPLEFGEIKWMAHLSLYRCTKGDETIYYDVTGNKKNRKIPTNIESMGYYCPLGKQKVNDKWRLMAADYEPLTKAKYDYFSNYMSGISIARKGNKLFAFDLRGEVVFKIKADSVHYFSNGRAVLEKNGSYGLVDKTGDVVIEPKYESVREFTKELYLVKSSGKVGVIANDGSLKAPIEFDVIGIMREGKSYAKKGGEIFLIHYNGDVEPKK